jgi:hypothetical protein
MRDARTMTAPLAVMLAAAALFACSGQGAREQAKEADAAKASSEAPPPAQDHANPAEPEHYDPASAAGAVKGIPAPTNTSGIEAVANYFAEVPGFDLQPLGEHGREKFLHRINSELCTCGCKNETIAWCLVNDPKCPTVKGLAQTVYDEVKKGS